MGNMPAFVTRSEGVVLTGVALGSILISLVILILEPLTGWPSWLRQHIPTITLLLLSTFVLAFFSRERVRDEYLRWKELGIRAIYRSRTDPAQYDAFIRLMNGIKENLFIVGITLKDVTGAHMSLLLDKAKKGCSIELLMLSPRYWQNRDPVLSPVAAATRRDLKPDFQLAISNIRTLAASLARTSARLEVRFYNQAPTLSLTIADGGSLSGRMIVELTPHNIPQSDYFRPMLDLQQKGENDLFGQFYYRYRALWDNSQTYLTVENSRVSTNKDLNKEISQTLELPYDWLNESHGLPDVGE